MRLRIRLLSGVGTDRHPALDGAAVAVSAEVAGKAAVRARVSFQAPAAVARSLRSLRAAVALVAEVPALGVVESRLLVDDVAPPGAAGRPNRRGPPPAAPAPGSLVGGQATAEVVLDPPPDRPITLWLRAALLDELSAPCKVELGPGRPRAR